MWQLARSASYELIEHPAPGWLDDATARARAAARRVGLCFCQQMLAEDPGKVPRTVRELTAQLLTEAAKPGVP